MYHWSFAKASREGRGSKNHRESTSRRCVKAVVPLSQQRAPTKRLVVAVQLIKHPLSLDPPPRRTSIALSVA